MKLLLFKFYVIAVAIFSKDHYLIFLRAQGDSQMDWFAAEAGTWSDVLTDINRPEPEVPAGRSGIGWTGLFDTA